MTASESAAELIESVVRKKFTDASIDFCAGRRAS